MNSGFSDSQDGIKLYIESLYNSSFNNELKAVVFDAISLDYISINDYFETQEDIMYYSYMFNDNDIPSPFYPFIYCIKDFFGHRSIAKTKEVFDELSIYFLHYDMLLSYIFEKPYIREPEVLRDEVYYESSIILESIVKLLDYISKFSDLVFYIGNLQFASESVIKLLQCLMQQYSGINLLLLMSIDSDILGYEEEHKVLDEFIEIADNKDVLVRVDSNYYVGDTYINNDKTSTEEKMLRLYENFDFLAIADCIKYAKPMYIEFNNNMSNIQSIEYMKLLKLLGKSHYLLKDKEAALFYDNIALSMAMDIDDQEEICDLHVRLAYDYSIRGEYDLARKHALVAMDVAKELNNEKLIYKCLFLNFIIDKEGRFLDIQADMKSFNRLIEMTKKYGYDNYLAMIYTNPHELHDHFEVIKNQEFDEGIEIAKRLGNSYQLSVAYHNKGIYHSKVGHVEEAFAYYKKSQRLKEGIGDNKRIAYIYNSLGYHYFLTEQYEASHIEYFKSFNASALSRDYNEVCMTLYNMALNVFMYGDYELVCDYIVKLIRLMKMIKINDMKYHSKKMIYNIYIISLIKSGEVIKARDVYYKVKIWGLKSIEDKKEEDFLNEMMEFFIAYEENTAEEILVGAERFITKEELSLIHFRKFYYVEKILFLKQKTNKNYMKEINTFKSEIIEENSSETLKKLNLLADPKLVGIFPKQDHIFTDISNDFERTLYTAKIDGNLLKLRNRINETNFLNLVLNMLVNEEDMDAVLIRLQQLIHDNTKVEKSYCRIVKGTRYEKLNVNNQKMIINEVYVERIFSNITDKSKASILQLGSASLMTLKKVYGYSSVMYMPIFVGGKRKAEFILMTQRQENKLNLDDLSIFTLVARQVGEIIERINNNKAIKAMNLKLKHLSTTDLLTGLYNRNALENQLQSEKQNVNKGDLEHLVILFIDLDNFKYYNDTFGHGVGDQVLVHFANILKTVTNEDDFVARFGGDEFVIILKEYSDDEAQKLVSEIYQKIKELSYFEKLVGRLIYKQVNIPKEYRLSCSIGMSSLVNQEQKDVDDLLKLSDQALYKAKGEGKNRLYQL